jgi:uncharacterized protein YjbI with pentapeptide repeats
VDPDALHPPDVPELDLPDLVAGTVEQLAVRSDHDGVRFSGDDLTGRQIGGSRFVDCEFDHCSLDGTDLGGVRLVDCRWSVVDVPILRAARTTWRGVEVLRSRIGSAELYDAEWRTVRVVDGKLGYLNFRNSTLTDVLFTGCEFEELDLSGATLTRVGFADCRAGTVTATGARLRDVDLRGLDLRRVDGLSGLAGASIDEHQLTELAPLLAAEAGLIVRPALRP